MRKIYFEVGAAFVMAVLLVGDVPGQQKPVWKGTTELVHGTKIIRNPAEALFGELKLELQEDLHIGGANSEQYVFNVIWDVKSDGLGNMYVADTRNARVQKVSSTGTYLKTLGKGSPNFVAPTRIHIEKLTGNIFIRTFVLDVQIFNSRDQFQGTISSKKNVIYDFEPIDGNRIMAVLGLQDDTKLAAARALFLLGMENEPKKISADFPFNLFLERSGGATSSSETGFELNLYLARIEDGSFVYGYSKVYELNVIDKDGRVLYRFTKEAPQPRYSTEERRVFWRRSVPIPVPEEKPHFFDILTDSEGRIYVQRNKTKGILNSVQEKTNRDVDIFSRDGYFLYTSVLPPNTCEIYRGFLYAYAVDEASGAESVHRYKIRNWAEIVTGTR